MSPENTLDPLTFEMPIRFRFSVIEKDIHCSQYLLVFTRCSLLQIVKGWDSNFKQIILNQKKRFNVALQAFFISNTFTSNASLKLAKNQAKAKQHSQAELLLFQNYSLCSSTLSFKNNRHILKNAQKTGTCV